VVDQASSGTAVVDSHIQSVEYQLRPEMVGHRPSDDLSRIGVQDKREVEPAFPGSHVSDVCYPKAIWSLRSEVALHEIWSRRDALGA
jgi:hypothetical protein